VNPGNSGGPLFNLAGEVIGINSQIYSRTRRLPGHLVRDPDRDRARGEGPLVKTGPVSRGKIGIAVQDVNASLAESFGLDRPRGALVSSVDPKGPGEKAGLQAGDIILSFDGKPIDRSSDLPVIVRTRPSAGARRSRCGATAASSRSRSRPRGQRAREGGRTRMGPAPRAASAWRCVRCNRRSARRCRASRGVVVEQVSGAAARAGLQPGDVVVSVTASRSPRRRTCARRSRRRAAVSPC